MNTGSNVYEAAYKGVREGLDALKVARNRDQRTANREGRPDSIDREAILEDAIRTVRELKAPVDSDDRIDLDYPYHLGYLDGISRALDIMESSLRAYRNANSTGWWTPQEVDPNYSPAKVLMYTTLFLDALSRKFLEFVPED